MTCSAAFRSWLAVCSTVVLVLLSACGGGGSPSGTSGGSMVTPPSALVYPSPEVFTVQQAVTAVTPTVMGSVTSYSVTPALPAGLLLDGTSGMLSGTPTVASPASNYTVTATNAGGNTTAIVSIAVDDVKPTVAYASLRYTFALNTSSAAGPSATGGAVVSWSVTPALPVGLTIDQTDGVISGVPTVPTPATAYTVTAANSGGQSTAVVTITVAAPSVLLNNVGPNFDSAVLKTNGNQVLTQGSNGDWDLVDFTSGSTIAAGQGFCGVEANCAYANNAGRAYVDLVGPIMLDAVQSTGAAATAVETRTASTGQIITTLSGSFAWYQLASDGSYVCTGSTSALIAWSPTTGQQITSRTGDYSMAIAYCAPGQMQVANGPAGANVIETVSATSGASVVSPAFSGTFDVWFADGSHFATGAGTAAWIYTSTAAQVEVVQLTSTTPPVGGWGNYFYTVSTNLNVFQIVGGATPALSIPLVAGQAVRQSGAEIAVLPDGAPQLTTVDMSATLAQHSYSSPFVTALSFAATSASNYLLGTNSGVIYDGAGARDVTLGQVNSITAGSSYFSVATASGQIYSYDANTDALVSTLQFPSSMLSTSATGTLLLAVGNVSDFDFQPATQMNLYSLPTGSLVNHLPAADMGTLSGSGTVVGQVFTGNNAQCYATLLRVDGTSILCGGTYSNNPVHSVQLSPDGTQAAVGTGDALFGSAGNLITYLYNNGNLSGAIQQAEPLGWLDNSHLLANGYATQPGVGTTDPAAFTGAAVYDTLGNLTQTTSLPLLSSVQVLSPSVIYSPIENKAFSIPSGAIVWSAGAGAISAATGSQVIYASGSQVLALPF